MPDIRRALTDEEKKRRVGWCPLRLFVPARVEWIDNRLTSIEEERVALLDEKKLLQAKHPELL